MKVYLASSWKNAALVREVATRLRELGFQVDDFTDESNGRFVFHYSEIGDINEINAVSFLKNEKAACAFKEDRKYIDWCDVCILVVPSGRDSHLEAGYAKGSGKHLIIWGQFPNGEFSVMYGFADLITDNFDKVIEFLMKKSVRCGDCSAFDTCPQRKYSKITEDSRQHFCFGFNPKMSVSGLKAGII